MEKLKYGYLKLFRQIVNWQWYKDAGVFRVFLHCLLRANYVSKNWRGMNIPTGSFVTSYQNLASEIGMSVQNVRTAVKKLVKTGNLSIDSNNRYTIITVNHYSVYQNTTYPNVKNQQNNGKTDIFERLKREMETQL